MNAPTPRCTIPLGPPRPYAGTASGWTAARVVAVSRGEVPGWCSDSPVVTARRFHASGVAGGALPPSVDDLV